LESRTLFSTVLDLAVVYTPAARDSVGGVNGVLQRVTRAVADANLILANSRVDATLRLVALSEIAYTETRDLELDLERLRGNGDGFMDAVHPIRNNSGADLVQLLVNDGGDEGGRAYQLDDPTQVNSADAFGVTVARVAQVEYVFAHEVMHQLGAGHHESEDLRPRNLPWARAYRVTSGTQSLSTVVGNAATRLPYLSSPQLIWRGITLGDATHDNARAVRQFVPLVAQNRATMVSDLSAPQAALLQTATAGGKTLTIDVRLADDQGINIASLGNGDLRVTGPSGFNKLASFVSVDRASNGGQRLARYSVDITGYSADPAAYTATVVAGQITDVAGKAVAAAALARPASSATYADRAGPKMATAMELGNVGNSRRQLVDGLTAVDGSNHYRFTLTSSGTVTARLSGLTANANLYLIQDRNNDGLGNLGEYLGQGINGGTTAETISISLAAGSYDLHVFPVGPVVTPYTLSLDVVGGSTGTSPSPPPPPPPPTTATGTITGTIWRDDNGNGVREAGEPALPNFQAWVDLDGDGLRESTDRTVITNTSGNYTIANLPAGRTYVVRPVGVAGYRISSSTSYSVPLAAGQIAGGKNFGFTTRALVSGTVWFDNNANRIRDAADAGLGGWVVFLDKDNDGVLDADEKRATTSSSGAYTIKDAVSGKFTLKVVNKTGYAVSTPTSGHAITLSNAQAISGKNFGVKRA
jgi:hypothetical protein